MISTAMYSVLWPVVLIPTFYCIKASRADHSEHISNLWYIFFLTFQVANLLYAYIYCTVVLRWPPITGLMGDVLVAITEAALNIRHEMYFVFGVSAFILLPQLLSYFISGLSGCAYIPSSLKWLDKFVAWSLIKFFIGLAGIMGAQAVFSIYGKPYRVRSDIPSRIFFMDLFLSVSFIIFLAYYEKNRFIEFLQKLGVADRLASVNAFMTRHVSNEKSIDEQRTITDKIFDYVVDSLWPELLRMSIRKALRTSDIDPDQKWPPFQNDTVQN